MSEHNLHTTTLAVHAGSRKDDAFGAINEPVYMTSNYRIPTDGTPVDWSGIHSNIYQRNRNPNQMVLQDKPSPAPRTARCSPAAWRLWRLCSPPR